MTKHPIASVLEGYDVVDLSHRLEEGMPNFPTHSQFSHEIWESYWKGDVAVAYQISMNEHSGTHVDAPAHFIQDGHPQHVWIDAIDPTALMARTALIDVSDTRPGTDFGPEMLERFEGEHGPVVAGDLVLFRTGWHEKWDIKEEFLKDWPGPSVELAGTLADRKVAGVGTDAIGLDTYQNMSYPVHYELLGKGILILENMANLSRLPPFFYVMAIPLSIADGSGSPLRPLAFIPKAKNIK
jgi:arylformamidase